MTNQRDPSFYEEMVDAINGLFGAHAGYRAAHAKGIYVGGTFRPAAGAARLSRAKHFVAPETRVTARFSNGSGLPTAADVDPDARGLAVKFHLDDGTITDLVSITVPAFFVRTPEDFIAFTRARRPLPETGKPDPAAIGAFVSRHPETQRAIQLAGLAPHATSYATATYNGIHTFILTNAEGKATPARYRLQPVNAPGAAAADLGADAFQVELRKRIESGPVSFDLQYIAAQSGDDLVDPTAPWPADRPFVSVGTLTLDRMLEQPRGAQDAMIFDPTNVTDGIACSEDPILHARAGAYSVSYARRTKA